PFQKFAASSEPYLAGKLEVPRIPRARDRSEGGAAKRAVRVVQGRSIADIKDFRPEFQIDPLRNPNHFADHQVGILESWPSHWIPRTVADAELAGGGESRLVEPFGSTASSEVVWIADAIRPLNGVLERGKRIRRLRDGHRVSRLHAYYAADFPTGDLPPSRNLVHPASGKDPGD